MQVTMIPIRVSTGSGCGGIYGTQGLSGQAAHIMSMRPGRPGIQIRFWMVELSVSVLNRLARHGRIAFFRDGADGLSA